MSVPECKMTVMDRKCDQPDTTADDYLDELRRTMQEHGWAVQYVESDRTPFAYTVGLHDCGLPELLMTGVSCAASDTPAEHRRQGTDGPARAGAPGQKVAVRSGPLVEIVEVANPDAHMKWAVAFGGPEVRALQLVWADGRGRWPWAAAFSDGRGRQPVLGARARQNA